MSSYLIWAIGIVYLYVAIEQILKGNVALGVSFIGYFIGNIGLGLVAKWCYNKQNPIRIGVLIGLLTTTI